MVRPSGHGQVPFIELKKLSDRRVQARVGISTPAGAAIAAKWRGCGTFPRAMCRA